MAKASAAPRGVKRGQPEAPTQLQLLDLPTELLLLIAGELDVASFETYRSLCHRTRNLVDQDARCAFWRTYGKAFFEYQLKERNGAEQLAYLAGKTAIAKAMPSLVTVTCDASVTTDLLVQHDAIFVQQKLNFCLRHPDTSRLRLNRLRSVTYVDMSAHPHRVDEVVQWDMMPPNLETLNVSSKHMFSWNAARSPLASLKKIIFKHNTLRSDTEIDLPRHIEVLCLADLTYTSFDKLSTLDRLTHLELVSVNFVRLDCDTLSKSLKTLVLSREAKLDVQLLNLQSLVSLTTLHCSSIVVEETITLPEKLEVLKFHNMVTFWDLDFPSTLTKVTITRCLLPSIPPNLDNAIALQELNLAGNDIARAPVALLPASIRSLVLSNNPCLQEMEDMTFLPNLLFLNVSNTPYGNSPRQVTYPASLRTLNLLETQGGFVWRHDFPEHLQSLQLSDSQVKSLSGVAFSANLKSIHITGTDITSLDEVSFPDGLSTLDLSGNKIKSVDGARFPQSLQSLFLQYNHIVTIARPCFPEKLQTLQLEGNRLVSISEQSLPISLVSLTLSRNPFVVAVYPFDRLINLRDLLLSATRLYSVDQLRLPPHLRTLNLTQNKFTSLKGFRLPQSMTHLNLCFNRFTSFGWPDLNEHLVTIDLSYCDIASFKDISLKAQRVLLTSTKVGSMNGFYIPHGTSLIANGMTVTK